MWRQVAENLRFCSVFFSLNEVTCIKPSKSLNLGLATILVDLN